MEETNNSKIHNDSTASEGSISGYLPKTGNEDESELTAVGLAMLAAIAAKKN